MIARFLAAFILVPAVSLACPMCYGSSPAVVLQSYYLTAALLSLLPFAVIGGIAVLAFRMARQRQAGNDALEDRR